MTEILHEHIVHICLIPPNTIAKIKDRERLLYKEISKIGKDQIYDKQGETYIIRNL